MNQLLKIILGIPVLNKKIYHISVRYIDIYRGFSYDFQENGEHELIKACHQLFMDSPPIIFDVGANIGNWTISAQNLVPNGVFHVFEMTSSTFEELERRLPKTKNIYLNKIALASKSGQIKFKNFAQSGNRNTTITQSNYLKRKSHIELATASSGDDYCQAHNVESIDLLKIDVEGAEMDVLKGFKELLGQKKINVIQFEYGYVNADAGTVMHDFYDFLEKHGYILGPLRKDGVRFKKFSYDDNDFKSGPNYVACLPQFVDVLSSFKF